MVAGDAWADLADAIAARDPAVEGPLVEAVTSLGVSDTDRSALRAVTAGRTDSAARLLRRVAGGPPAAGDYQFVLPYAATGPEMDRALAIADDVRTAPADLLSDRLDEGMLAELEVLPAPAAGVLVLDVVHGAAALEGRRRLRGLGTADTLLRAVPVSRLPLLELVRLAVPMSPDARDLVARLLARASLDALLRAVARAEQSGADPDGLADLLAAVARERTQVPAFRSRRQRPTSDGGRADLPEEVLRGAREPSRNEPPAPSGGEAPGGAEPLPRTAYALLDVVSNTARADVVVTGEPFTAVAGLTARRSKDTLSTGAVRLPGGTSTLDLVLLYDPESFRLDGPARHTLTVSDDTPYPSVSVNLTALYVEDGPPVRRIGVQLLSEGRVAGLVWRGLAVVDEPGQVDGAPSQPGRERQLLDLAPLLDPEPPDLVLSVCRSEVSADTWVWSAYAADPAVSTPDGPNSTTLTGHTATFAANARRFVERNADRVAEFVQFHGQGLLVGAAVPRPVEQSLRSLLALPGRTSAPTVLLLTEEPFVPWEIAAFRPPLASPWGGDAPFLGAHVAVGRWPLVERRPRPDPRREVTVRDAAVVTAKYVGVPRWGELAEAEAEAVAVAGRFTPPARTVDPTLVTVLEVLTGQPRTDLIHVALHGQFDGEGNDEGIVLIRKDPAGAATAQFLTPVMAETGALDGTFVFLNACQVAASRVVLGSYGGFADTLLRIGAGGVVAPLWNVDDAVAGAVAEKFYDLIWPTEAPGVTVGEALRLIRAGYTRAAVDAATPGVMATLVAFQFFGHPGLRLCRP